MELVFRKDQEYLRLQHEYPSVWEAAIGNKGKQIAVFDKAQQQRNKHCTFKSNKEELIYVYVLITFKSFIEPTIYKLNMRELLNNQEVLAINFNDSIESADHDDHTSESAHIHDHMGILYIQGKDLTIY